MKLDRNSKAEKEILEPKGLALLTDRNILSMLRMPMLDVIYDVFIRRISIKLKEMVNAGLVIETKVVQTAVFHEYLDANQASVFALLSAPQLQGDCLLCIKNELAYAMMNALLGGAAVVPSAVSKSYTVIEMEMLRYITNFIVDHINEAFASVLPMQLKLERLEVDGHSVQIVKNDETLNILRVQLQFSGIKSEFDLVLPYFSIEPIRKILSRPYVEGKLRLDPSWCDHFEKEMHNIKVKLDLVLDGSVSEIQELLSLKVGNTVVLDKFAEEPLDVRINGTKVTMGKLGKAGDKVAIQLTDDINISKFNHVT